MNGINKRTLWGAFVLAGILVVIAVISCTENPGNKNPPRSAGKPDTVQAAVDSILYWTCSMHPTVRSDKPGDCPICGMDLIPVRKKDQGSIVVDAQTIARLGINTAPAGIHELMVHLTLPGRVANDQDLFVAQQEYLSAITLPGDLVRSARLKLFLSGMSEAQIRDLEERGHPDETLISPSQKRAWIYAQAYESDLNAVHPGQNVSVTLSAYPDTPLKGTIRSVSPTIDPETRSATARIELYGQHRILQLGMYAEVHVMASKGAVLAVPASAVINTGTRNLVYMETEPGRFIPQPVVTGMVSDEYVEIKSGLQAGDRIVTAGNFLLDSQSNLAGGQSLVYGSAADVDAEKPAAGAGPTHQH